MFDFIQRFFGKPPSSTTAKERLRLVLLSDHLSLAPDVVESLKHDLIDVISRYVDVDAANCDVSFEQQDKQVAMLANIPILGMRSRPKPPAATPPPPAVPPPPAREPEPPPALDLGGATASVAAEPVATTTVLEPAAAVEHLAPATGAPAASAAQASVVEAAASAGPASAPAHGSRKKRRKRPNTSAAVPSAG